MTDDQINIMVKKCSKGTAYLSDLIREQLKEAYRMGVQVGWEEGYNDGKEVAEGMYTRYD